MAVNKKHILVWLPSPMGDAVLSTPALRAIRKLFCDDIITFYCNDIVHQVLEGTGFNDNWIVKKSNNPFKVSTILKKQNLEYAILFKNSFASALSCFLAHIPVRIGYAREARGFMLTEKLYPPKKAALDFEPFSMLDYYLAIASWLGGDTDDRQIELAVSPEDRKSLDSKIPEIFEQKKSLVILVPGGAFGPSKCWPADKFAQTADRLIEKYNANVVVSVSSAPEERQIADDICSSSKNDSLINLGRNPLSLGELKALFSICSLVITNDTGPRHIAIAFKRNVITLFGPNDPAWTETGWENEIKIIGKAPCAPCEKPNCRKNKLYCMLDISVDMVCDSADRFLSSGK